MGGSTERGNHTPAAEFNTYADPEALDIVLRSGVPVRMVGLNLTHQALATPEVVERMQAMPHVVGGSARRGWASSASSYQRIWEFSAPPVHDPCTIAPLLDPDWSVARFLRGCRARGTWTRGTTVVDLYGRLPDHAPNVSVAMELDAGRYWELVLGAIDNLGTA